MEAIFIKTSSQMLVPASEQDAELLKHIKLGQPTKLKFTRVRNYLFHKKYFALLNLAFEYWEPPKGDMPTNLNADPEKNFDRFRKDVAILAGFYDATYRLNGDVRLEAKSIAFSAMSEKKFEVLYSKTIDVVLKHILKAYTGEQLRSMVDDIIGFV